MVILDTHIWLWWINEDSEKLKPVWVKTIEQEPCAAISSISLFEVSWLSHHDRIKLPTDIVTWLIEATQHSLIEVLPINPEIAQIAVSLPYHHRDPQDRLIIASAIFHKATLISADTTFGKYEELKQYLLS